MEHIKQLEFIVSPNVQIAAPSLYVNEINKKVRLHQGRIEIKKKITFEKNFKSKVLMIYAMEQEAKETDQKILNTTFDGFKYVSFRLSSSSQRLAAMHSNDMLNPKARFETLHNTNLNNTVLYQGLEYKLKNLIQLVEVKDMKLFLAIEQGSGKNSKNTYVVINPKTRNRAR